MPPPPDPNGVFLNLPYDIDFRPLYLAYIVGLSSLQLVPHLTSEITGSERRLDRVFKLLQSCRYSIHDLSRVEVLATSEAVPRFNMPLELGMAVTLSKLRPKKHDWFVCESKPYRLQRSASDLNGTDPLIHDGTPEGVLRQLSNAFWRSDAPSVPQMLSTFSVVERSLSGLLDKHRTHNPYDRSIFMELCWLSQKTAFLFS